MSFDAQAKTPGQSNFFFNKTDSFTLKKLALIWQARKVFFVNSSITSICTTSLMPIISTLVRHRFLNNILENTNRGHDRNFCHKKINFRQTKPIWVQGSREFKSLSLTPCDFFCLSLYALSLGVVHCYYSYLDYLESRWLHNVQTESLETDRLMTKK